MSPFYFQLRKTIPQFLFIFLLATHFTTTTYGQPTGFIDQEYVGGFEQAVGLTFDANGRMYVWEKQGKIWIVENGVKSSSPLLDISEEVGNWRDFGLLGVALDPDFLSNGNIYLLYIVDRHHLLNFGTNNYSSTANDYFDATIGRITRYTAEASTAFTTVDYSTRQVLLGETVADGFPSLHESHGTGHLIFGEDGTLMASFGDGASFNSVDQGSASETYYQQAIADGIISSAENIGAYRSQLLNNYAGKLLRIDPQTGEGIPSNPYYQSGNPNSVQSKVWARGLRNPCRFTKRPGTGSHNPADGNPGVFYIGDVGWGNREELNVVDEAGLNFGWPKYEGMTHQPGYNNNTYTPSTHELAKLDWRNGVGRGSINGTIFNIGTSQIPGDNVFGNCSMGGTWYDGNDFPADYQNTYFHADYGGDWIMNFKFDANNNPTETRNFKTGADRITFVGTSEFIDGIFYVAGLQGNSNPTSNSVRRITYTGNNNLSPITNLSVDILYGSSPLTVELQGSQSYDPDGDGLTYTWDFGDGTTSNSINPIHTFTSGNSNPTSFTVSLTVSDGNLSNQKTIEISLNNTPPNIISTSIDGTNSFNSTNGATLNLTANVNDAEHSNASLTYQWFTELHHNNHFHQEPVDNNASTSVVLSPIGCDGATYFYKIKLIVTDPEGAYSIVEKDIYPNCNGSTQTITFNNVPDKLTTDTDFNLTASTNSGLPIIYHIVQGPATVSGNTVSLTGEPGEVWLRAIQSGNGTYQPAEAVDQFFNVNILSGDCPGLGSISREVWTNAGTSIAVASIPVNTTPNIEDEMFIFETPSNILDGYGTRLRGYLCPAVSGNYTFWIASDDNGELWLSTDETAGNRVLIANVPEYTGSRQWTKYPEQQSTTINLTAGQRYYVEALMKEGGGGDNLAVGWRLPDNTLERPISQQYLLPWDGGIQSQTITFPFIANKVTTDADFTLAANASSNLAVSYSIVSGPATVSGNTISLDGTTGTVVVRASQNGNANYLPATAVDRSFTVSLPNAILKSETAVVNNIGNSWQTINLDNTYNSPIIVATPVLELSTDLPVVTRVRNITGTSFQLKIQNPSNTVASGYTVHYVVVEEGVYTTNSDGVKMEAVKVNSTSTARSSNWTSEFRTYNNTYTNPVVLAQVMSHNDSDWSVAHITGASRTQPPSSTQLSVTKHIGADADITRADELIGYIVIESGSGTFNDLNYTTARGADIVLGVENTSTGYSYPISNIANPTSAILTNQGEDGGDGSWPVLYGNNPVTSSEILLAVDEDQIGDNERSHTTEEVAYIVFENVNQPTTFVSFNDGTSLLGNTDFHSGVAIGIADMNGDSKDDIVRLDDAKILNIEYQNNPNTSFSNYTFGSVSASNQWSLCIGDADENGFNDIVMGGNYDNVKLLKANNNGSALSLSILPNSNMFIQGSNFVDINNDGAVDIFACHDDAESLKWENNGNGNYTRNNNLIPTITDPVSDNSGNYASAWTDYDNDGDLDLYISKCRGGVNDPTDPRRINQLFQNDGNNNFTEAAAAAGLKIDDQTWSTDFADIDNDGDLDVFMLNHFSPSLLFINNGNGTFTDITSGSGLDQNLDLFGIQAIFRDFDNDRYVDLIVTGTEHRMFKNNGNSTFTQITNPFTSDWIESLAIGDLNSDGFLDIYAGYANLFTSPSTIDDQLFLNQGNDNNWIQIDLEGTVSNRNGIGARVELHGSWGKQIREVRSGEGYGIHNSFLQHFGIGDASQITKVVVKWPSGVINEVNSPSINQILTIIEEAPSGCATATNLALDKPATQSGTQLGAEASRANDGNTNGDFWSANSVSLTNWAANSWWEVDLQNVSQIDEINLWNRTDCCENLFANFYIFVSNTPFTSTNLNTTLNQSGVSSYLVSGTAGTPTTQAINTTGRYVRVQLTGTAYLAIAEVEVIGCVDNSGGPINQAITFDPIADKLTTDNPFNISATATSGLAVSYNIVSGPATISGSTITLTGNEGTVVVAANQAGNAQFNSAPTVTQNFEVIEPQVGSCTTVSNLALDKSATQSGTQLGAEASRANDGNTNGNFWAGNSVSLTNWASNSWWEVDLQVLGNIETINLWNRTDCCDELFGNYYVFVSDIPFASQNLNATINQSGVSSYLETAAAGTPTTININRTGKYIRVQLVGTAYLAIAEVEVMGCVDSGGGPLNQSIAFEPITDKLTTDLPFDLAATASSGLPVSYTVVSGPATVSGNTITLTGVEGTVTVRASQSGNSQFNPAANVNRVFEVTEPLAGLCNSTSNIAIGKTATQSGTQLGADADRAIDGNTDGNFWATQSVTLTNWVGQAWWEVDLEGIYNIDEINLWTRTDCCTEHFSDFYVFVSDVPFTSTNLNATLSQPGVDNYFVAGEAGLPTTLPIIRTGRYVRVQISGFAYLAIAEVEIMGCTTSNINPNDTDFTNLNTSQNNLNQEELKAKVFPNPAENEITVELETPTDNNLKIVITDTKGSIIHQHEFYANAGKHGFKIDVSKFPIGNYIVYLQHSDLKKVIQFIKIH